MRIATGSRLIAETDGRSADLYRTCGFSVTEPRGGRVRCTLVLREEAGRAASVRATTLEEAEAAIRASWGRDTSDDPDEWSEENPARGQCAVTAHWPRAGFSSDHSSGSSDVSRPQDARMAASASSSVVARTDAARPASSRSTSVQRTRPPRGSVTENPHVR